MSPSESKWIDPSKLQSIVDFLHWIFAFAKMEAIGLVANVPVVNGDSVMFREIKQQAAAHAISPRKDSATIRRVYLQALSYSGSKPASMRTVEKFVNVVASYQLFADLGR